MQDGALRARYVMAPRPIRSSATPSRIPIAVSPFTLQSRRGIAPRRSWEKMPFGHGVVSEQRSVVNIPVVVQFVAILLFNFMVA